MSLGPDLESGRRAVESFERLSHSLHHVLYLCARYHMTNMHQCGAVMAWYQCDAILSNARAR
eukprot:694704-Rhodomonas_salina.6